MATVYPDDYYQGLAKDIREYRQKYNATEPLYTIESASGVNKTYLYVDDRNDRPYLSQTAPRWWLSGLQFWYFEAKSDGDFHIRNAFSRNASSLVLWDTGTSGDEVMKARVVMSKYPPEIEMAGRWKIVPFV